MNYCRYTHIGRTKSSAHCQRSIAERGCPVRCESLWQREGWIWWIWIGVWENWDRNQNQSWRRSEPSSVHATKSMCHCNKDSVEWCACIRLYEASEQTWTEWWMSSRFTVTWPSKGRLWIVMESESKRILAVCEWRSYNLFVGHKCHTKGASCHRC